MTNQKSLFDGAELTDTDWREKIKENWRSYADIIQNL